MWLRFKPHVLQCVGLNQLPPPLFFQRTSPPVSMGSWMSSSTQPPASNRAWVSRLSVWSHANRQNQLCSDWILCFSHIVLSFRETLSVNNFIFSSLRNTDTYETWLILYLLSGDQITETCQRPRPRSVFSSLSPLCQISTAHWRWIPLASSQIKLRRECIDTLLNPNGTR